MPTYEYICRKCGHEFDQFQSMNDAPLRRCPKCKKLALKRLVGAGAGLIFKGTGFYITDYRKTPAPKEGGEGKSEGEKKAGGEGKPGGDAKPGGGESKSGDTVKPDQQSKQAADPKPSAKEKPPTEKKR